MLAEYLESPERISTCLLDEEIRKKIAEEYYKEREITFVEYPIQATREFISEGGFGKVFKGLYQKKTETLKI